jgi:hypothetical protein
MITESGGGSTVSDRNAVAPGRNDPRDAVGAQAEKSRA